MKIFGFEIFKETEFSKRAKVIWNFLEKLSMDDVEILFYKLTPFVSGNPSVVYKHSDISFDYPNLHPKICNFFSKFEYFEVDENPDNPETKDSGYMFAHLAFLLMDIIEENNTDEKLKSEIYDKYMSILNK